MRARDRHEPAESVRCAAASCYDRCVQALSTFAHGFSAPWRSLRLLWGTPRLWPLAAAPAAITGTLLFVAILAAVLGARPTTVWLLPGLVRWPAVLFVAKALIGGVLAMVFGSLAYMVGALLSLPFSDNLSEQVEATCYDLPSPIGFREALPASIRHSLLGFGFWLMLQVLCLPLQLLPGVGSVLDFVLGASITAFFLAHQMMDGPMSRWRLSFREKLDLLWTNLPLALGLGFAATLMLALPLINLLSLPVCVGAGALLYAEINPLAPSRER